MSTIKVVKSNSIAKGDEPEKMQSKFTIRHLEAILSGSFMFTVLVACCILLYINNNNRQNAMEIEKIVERMLIARDLVSRSDDVHRRNRYNDDNDLKRSKRFIRGLSDGPEKITVEFFDPKLRTELEKNDTERMKRTGLKGAAPNGDTWVWLTSYSRIPFEAIQGFCNKTKEYCPPGPIGRPGVAGKPGSNGKEGIKGDKGDRGEKGDSIKGEKGIRGPRGPRGPSGINGLNGKDGIPGGPGIDGMNGRHGQNGIPGNDGRNGTNGIDGSKGERGLVGPKGEKGDKGQSGEKGIQGPKGFKGRDGKDGTHGSPGVCLYGIPINDTVSQNYLIAPHIPSSKETKEKDRLKIVLNEGDNLRLRCSATGNPQPKITWERKDGKPINLGSWEVNSVESSFLNLTKINRVHIGTYVCTADNGIPPEAKRNFYVDVHFPPLVRIKTQSIYADKGSNITLQCDTEAFPEPLRYWERSDGLLIENQSNKYSLSSNALNPSATENYKYKMELSIGLLHQNDFGEYHCVSKNELGMARGIFYILGKSPDVTRPLQDISIPQLFGKDAPPKESYDDLCPIPEPCVKCPSPKDFKCKDAILSLHDLVGGSLEVKPTGNLTYPGLQNRTQDCVLNAIGKPVYHNYLEMIYGAWLRDSMTNSSLGNEKIWLTKENENNLLYEYKNKADFRSDKVLKKYRLVYPFKGNAHIVYNENFYYFCKEGLKIVRYDLKIEKAVAFKNITGVNETSHLYTTNYNVVDFNADDNGVWIIYSTPDSNHTIVSKIDAMTLEDQYSFNISVYHNKVGEMFIVCGVLYAVDSVSTKATKIRFALDLYTNNLIEVDLPFSNPFNRTTTIGYNHKHSELYTWNMGNQLTYPVRYNYIGYNETAADKNEEYSVVPSTGFSVFRINQDNN